MKLQLAVLWTCVVGTLSGALWTFNNIAWASDINRIEVRLIKRDLRDLRKDLAAATNEEVRQRILDEIEELLDDLCMIEPGDRECGN